MRAVKNERILSLALETREHIQYGNARVTAPRKRSLGDVVTFKKSPGAGLAYKQN